MCIAIYKPRNTSIRTAHFKSCFKSNPHGAGFALALGDGKMQVEKGFFKIEDFLKAWDALDTHAVPALIHFRVATHGTINEDNCHPFPFTGGDGQEMAAIHNGVLGEFGRRSRDCKDDKSDTRMFTEKVLAKIADKDPDSFFKIPQIKEFIEVGIGRGNKVVVLRADGDFQIFNEKLGEWAQEDGGKVWYSNSSYKTWTGDQEGYFRGRRVGPSESGRVAASATGAGPFLLPRPTSVAAGADGVPPNSWGAGVLACNEGKPYVAAAPDLWKEGYRSTVEKLFDDPIWYEGYADAVVGLQARNLKSGTPYERRGATLYTSGYQWGEWELSECADDAARERLAEEVVAGYADPPKVSK